MPQGKEEIIRFVNDWIAQMKQKKRANAGQDFAEVYVEEEPAPAPENPAGQAIQPLDPAEHEIRRRFIQMRRLSKKSWFSKNTYSRLQADLFYEQAKFMADFEDDYEGCAPFSMYYPDYQSMSYEQLRTYFTWRSGVRRGEVRETSFSYVFVYLYELLNGIGTQGSEDCLRRLLAFWEAYRPFEKKLDRYLADWVKDYYIVHPFSFSFDALVRGSALLQAFYQPEEERGFFERYAPYSAYPYQKSIFWTAETEPVLRACFNRVMEAVSALTEEAGVTLDSLLFAGRKGTIWQPFRKALYHSEPAKDKAERLVKISESEFYRFDGLLWTTSKNRVCRENGRQIIGYILKRIEQFYRKAMKFRYQITASRAKIDLTELGGLGAGSGGFFACVDDAILECYRASGRKSVTVDPQRLSEIREDALRTQEKLLAHPEGEAETPEPHAEHNPPVERESELLPSPPAGRSAFAEPARPPVQEGPPMGDVWERLAQSLDPLEREALRLLVRGASAAELAALAKRGGRMPEVLIDSINEKAVDTVEDTILDYADTIEVFAEYIDELERVMFSEAE